MNSLETGLIVFGLIIKSNPLFSQNLVVNPGFEIFSQCPVNPGQVSYATSWNQVNTADYFNSCSTSPISVPYNWGYQYPASGEGYCGLATVIPTSPGNREFLIGTLSLPLSIGSKYYVSFKTSLCYSDPMAITMATNKLGVLFSTNSQSSPWPALPNFAHVFSDSIITDTLNWTRISGAFTADSSYQYLKIGNWFDDSNTDTITFQYYFNRWAYYYIDDVCVSTDSNYCANYSLVNEIIPVDFQINLYPNPVTDKLNVDFEKMFTGEISIFDMNGKRLVTENILHENALNIDISNLLPGYYFLRAENQFTVRQIPFVVIR